MKSAAPTSPRLEFAFWFVLKTKNKGSVCVLQLMGGCAGFFDHELSEGRGCWECRVGVLNWQKVGLTKVGVLVIDTLLGWGSVVVLLVEVVPAASRCLWLGLHMNKGALVLPRWRLGRRRERAAKTRDQQSLAGWEGPPQAADRSWS